MSDAERPDLELAALGGAPARRGIAVPLWSWKGASAKALTEYAESRLGEIAALGATDVSLVVSWVQADVKSSAIAPAAVTPPDEVVSAAIAAARARGLRVLVFPILMLEKTAAGEWRGTVAPGDVDTWWMAYERFVLHYAAIAAAGGAPSLSIGSELGSTEAWQDRWYHLISGVEKIFPGELTYSANWDHYKQVSFASRLDLLGVTGYFELTKDAGATEAALTDAWKGPRKALVDWARGLAKPLAVTEIGYPSLDGAATRPWDYTRSAKIDLEEQRRAYRAFARAWSGQALAAVYFWEWSAPGGPGDGGYTPRGKPAEQELKAWFRGR